MNPTTDTLDAAASAALRHPHKVLAEDLNGALCGLTDHKVLRAPWVDGMYGVLAGELARANNREDVLVWSSLRNRRVPVELHDGPTIGGLLALAREAHGGYGDEVLYLRPFEGEDGTEWGVFSGPNLMTEGGHMSETEALTSWFRGRYTQAVYEASQHGEVPDPRTAAEREPLTPDSFGGTDEGSHLCNSRQGHERG